MKSNDLIRFMLFLSLTFLITSCGALRNTSSGGNIKKVDAVTVKRNNLAKSSKKYIGVKYKYAGKDPKGFDCSGFTSYVMKSEGVTISSSSKAQAVQGKSVPINKVKPGDLIFFGKRGKVTHVAMVISNTSEGITVIHSTSSKGVMVQNISISNYWKPKILFARDILG
ncbi:MAG: cell wall-associated NlpC family hydrolase [Cognaticolwellia sp.]|jgi:cell wall-associated NlpC family hydrolase